MAEAPDPSTPAATAPPRAIDPVHAQRAMVYTLVGLMCLTGLAIGMALSDPCRRYGGEVALASLGQRCKDVVTWSDYLPELPAWLTLLAIFVNNILLYELRWVVRVAAPVGLGVVFLATAVIAFVEDQPGVLVAFYVVFATGLFLAAWGILRGRREGWSFALSITSVVLLGHFFGSAKIATETGWPMAYALLPSLALMLPVVVALATTPPGSKRYAPFATRPSAEAG